MTSLSRKPGYDAFVTPDIWWTDSGSVVVSAFLVALVLYFAVVLAFRFGKRRTVAELAPFDLAAVIAIGAIIGRTATGGDSVLVGVVAVLGLLIGHAIVSRTRHLRPVQKVVDQPTAVLVMNGQVRPEGLRRAGLTTADLEAALRASGCRSLEEVAVAVFETRHGVSVLRPGGAAPLWRGLEES